MRIYPRHELAAQKARDLEKVRAIVETTGERPVVNAGTRSMRNTAGDARVLRMIPVCAEGVGGTIPDTNPLQCYIDEEARRERRSSRIRT